MQRAMVAIAAICGATAVLASASPAQATSATSQFVTWTCTSSPCPWGPTTDGHAYVWPASMNPISNRLGYTTSQPIYLPASQANGLTVSLSSGSAAIYAGTPQASGHRFVANLAIGQPHTISGIAADEVISIQFANAFDLTYTTGTPPTTTTTTAAPSTTTTTVPADPNGAPLVTWTCTSSPCPWGPSTSGHAYVWPVSMLPSSTRLGYTTSHPIYLPAAHANGLTLTLSSGSAAIYAGTPQASGHRFVANLGVGQPFTVTGVAADEVISVQSPNSFTLQLMTTPPPSTTTTTTAPPTTTTTTTAPTTTTTTTAPTTTTTTAPTTTTTAPTTTTTLPPDPSASRVVTWSCVSSPCPWGPTTEGHAYVWPADMNPGTARLGYTTSEGIYLPAAEANGLALTLTEGSAAVYAGTPQADGHRYLTTLTPGTPYTVNGIATDEVISVQGNEPFNLTYEATTPVPPCTDPMTCEIVTSIRSSWRCNIPGCTYSDWVGSVVAWPSWAAYSSNARLGENSRTVYADSTGEVLHAYMGSWASGCTVTAVTGEVLIIEWQRGTDTWRSTYLSPGQSHTIQLVSPEDGALIESPDTPTDFAVQLDNCSPQPIA